MSESDKPLIAECPSCQTRFRVTVEQLAVADGRVRCGACLTVFDGRAATVADVPIPAADPIDILLDGPATAETARDESVAEEAPVESTAAGDEDAEPTSGRRLHPAVLVLAIAAALGALAVGVLVLQYETFVQHPVLREAYEAAGMDLPAYRALDAIRVDNPSVDERTGAAEDLIVRLNLANTAPRHQRFPTLAVRFYRADGEALPEQRIDPAAYLPSPTHTRRMTPNKRFAVQFRLDDPGREAASYSISLL